MFFLHSILKERIHNIQNKLNGISSDKNRYKEEVKLNQGRSWWDKFLNGDNTRNLNTRISNLSDEEKNLSSQLAELEQVFSNMKNMFEVCKIFYEGQPISF